MESCPEASIACDVPGCGATYRRREQEKHDRDSFERHLSCELKALEQESTLCFNGCGEVVMASHMDEHCRSCPLELVPCRVQGCSSVLKRMRMDEHVLVVHPKLAARTGLTATPYVP